MPDDVEIIYDEEEYGGYVFDTTDRIPSRYNVDIDKTEDNVYNVYATVRGTSYNIDEDNDLIMNIKCSYTSNSGIYKIIIANQEFNDNAGNTVNPSDYEVRLEVVIPPNYLNYVNTTLSSSTKDNEIAQTATGEYAANKVKFTDSYPFYITDDFTATRLEYTRNFKKTTWQAFFVPFDMSYEEWSAHGEIARINNIHQYDTDEDGVIDETKIEFIKVTDGKLVPNIPYVFKPNNAEEITFVCNNSNVKSLTEQNGYVDCSSTVTTYKLTGTTETTNCLKTKGAYTLFDGSFRPIGADNVDLAPFRFYLTISQRNGFYNGPLNSQPERIKITVDGEEEVTDIEFIEKDSSNSQIYYNMQGMPVANPDKGIYILKGKKILVTK